MFFPYGTNAPIYHWPITTVAMIAVNALVFCATFAHPETAGALVLEHGNGLHPTQWLTSNFIHAGIMHLVGNMLSLWSFGLVVEGKLGWYKTLAVFLGIGIVQCAIEQVLMLGAHGGISFGASAIVFGFMAMSLIWAPENDMQCILLISVRPIDFEMNIKAMAALSLGIEIVVVIFTGIALSSAVLHLMGAALGLAIAIWMLKTNRVDCENWDIFSVLAGRHTTPPEERSQPEAQSPESPQDREERLQRRRNEALDQVRRCLAAGQPAAALKAHQFMTKESPGWKLPEPELFDLIKALHQKKSWAESVAVMTEYLAHYAQRATLVRLTLAQVLVAHEKRPAQALKALSQVDEAALDGRQREFLAKLRAKAQQLREQEVFEVADDEV